MTNPVLAAIGRPFRLGIAGGAPPSAIGPMHRIGAAMDGRFSVVAGSLSSRPWRARQEGLAIGLVADRCYGTVDEMITREAERPDGIEALAIITPNDSHAAYMRRGLEAGLDLMIEKPLCNDLGEARELAELAATSGRAAVLLHTYSGYPMIREMRARIRGGAIGVVRFVEAEYLSGGLATLVEAEPGGETRWRLQPEKVGPSLVLGDIGTHAHHLACFVTGQRFATVSADVGTLVPGRRVHDIAQVRFRLEGGARGRLDVCNAAAGAVNRLAIRVYGETGHLAWDQDDHTRLTAAGLDGEVRRVGSAAPGLSEAAAGSARIRRPGHPEGLHEAVANLYAEFAELMLARRGLGPPPADRLSPSVADGVDGLAFVMACLASHDGGGMTYPVHLPALGA